LLADDYPKATKQIAGSAWVNLGSTAISDMAVFRNAAGALTISGGEARIVGQFELGLILDLVDGQLRPTAAVGIGPNVARATATAPLTTGTWHHLAFSADGAQLRLYVDGQEGAVVDYLADINPPDIPWISFGSRLITDTNVEPAMIVTDPNAPNQLIGQLDDVGLWTRALTAEEVSLIYEAGQQGESLETVIIEPPTELEITGISISGGNVTVTWSGGGTLYSTDSLEAGASWTSTGDSDGSYSAPVGTGSTFFQVQQ
jgi:hypothetical protein